MTAMFPSSGVPASDAKNSIVNPDTQNCDELWYSTSRCQPRFDPAAANATLAELINLINKGEVSYDCEFLDQVQLAVRYLIQRGEPQGVNLTAGPNDFLAAMTPPLTRYNDFLLLKVVPPVDNLAPTRINVDGRGFVPILRNDGQPIASADMRANVPTILIYWHGNFYVPSMVASQAQGAVFLNGNRDWYVNDAIGSDTLYDGSQASITPGSAHGPFKTIQHACDEIPKYNLNGYNVTIHVADGNYAGFQARPLNGSGTATIIGNPANPAACNVTGMNASAAYFAETSGIYYFRGFKVSVAGSSSDPMVGIGARGNSTIVFLGEMEFGPSSGGHIVCSNSALIANYIANCIWKISGSSANAGVLWIGSFFTSATNGNISYSSAGPPNIQIVAPVTFAVFAYAISFGSIGFMYSSLTGAGNVTGQRYSSTNLSLISTGGGGPNYFPGTVAGVTGNGGLYV